MAERGFREVLKLLRRREVGRLCIAYLVTYAGTAMAPIAMVAAGSVLSFAVFAR